MANDASNHPTNSSDADMSGDHAEFDAVQLAQANTPQQPQKTAAAIPAVPNGTVHVDVPQGEKVVRVAVANGETVVLPAPFDDQGALAAKEGNGNLAVKVGDITVILEGYQQTVDASGNPTVTLEDAQGDKIDIATVLASTDPNLDIETAAGPAAGAQGADNTGALLSAFAGGPGLGGLNAVGVLDATALQYKLIDNSILQERADALTPQGPLTFTVNNPFDKLNQAFLRDPIVTLNDYNNNPTYEDFINGNGKAPAWDNHFADFDGTQAGQGDMHVTGSIVVDPNNDSTVDVTLTTDGLKAQNLTSNGVPLVYVVSQDGTTIFGFRGDGSEGTDGALVLVVHVADQGTKNPDGTTTFIVDYYLANRLDDAGDGTHLNVSFDITTGADQTASGTTGVDYLDDAPIAKDDTDSVGNLLTTDGNVETGVGTTSGKAGIDLGGADGATVTDLVGKNGADHNAADTLTVKGEYGTLVMNADGSYTYTRDNDAPTVDKNGNTITLQDKFTYTLTDDDGDKTTANLTIDIRDNPVIVTPPPPPGGGDNPIDLNKSGTAVFESGLPDGSKSADDTETTKGSVKVDAKDGVSTITVDGHDVKLDGTPTTFTGKHGDITLTWDSANNEIDYTYTLKDNDLDHSKQGNDIVPGEDFKLEVTDKDGDVGKGDINIVIVDDVPDAKNDSDLLKVGETTQTGNVITGEGTTEGKGGTGTDVLGADGASVSAVVGAKSSDNDASNGLTVQGQYGTLTLDADGNYTYTRDPGSPGGVQDVFIYTLKDKDGDTDQATLTINIGDDKPTVDAPDADGMTKVYEKGLPQGSGELADGDSGNDSDKSEKVTGTINYTEGDAPAAITITGKDGKAVTVAAGVDIVGADGTLHINSVSGGKIDYTYTLTTNTSGDNTTDDFKISITDKDGDNATDDLVIKIVDDTPTAHNDTDSVGNHLTTDGNVVTGVGTTSGNAGIDIYGADGGSVVGVVKGDGGAVSSTGVGTDIQGTYGKLHLNADGSYTYTRDTDAPLKADDKFTYTVKDGDGDTSTAVLTININDNPVIVTPPPPPGGGDNPIDLNKSGTAVFESGLPDGSKSADDTETTKGSVKVDAKDGVDTITVTDKDGNPHVVKLDGTPTTITGNHGDITLTWDKANNEIDYTYTLKDNDLDHSKQGNDIVPGEDFKVVVTDSDGDKGSGDINIVIVDDVPTARNDTDLVDNATNKAEGNVVTGEGTTGGLGGAGADTKGADGATVTGVVSNATKAADNDASDGLTVQGQYGKLELHADGSYTYTRDPSSPGNASESFTYTLTDKDGDTSTATLTVGVNDKTPEIHAPTVDGQTTVYEKGLPQGSGELADGNSANDSDKSEKVSGTITYNEGDAPATITIQGKDGPVAVVVGATIVGADGTMVITSVGGGSIGYTYTLTTNTSGDATHDDFKLSITDKDGDTATDTLVVKIVDDTPDARNDTDTLAVGETTQTGNVITGVGTTSGAAGADLKGADGASVSAVVGAKSSDTDASNGLDVQGQYGKLHLNADGSYTYTRDAGSPGGVTDTFTYTLKDGDGNTDTATLTINVGDDRPTVHAPTIEGQTTVYEKGLPQGSGELADGNSANDSDKSEKVSGTIAYTEGDAPAAITITDKDGKAVTVVAGATIVGADGTLHIDSVSGGNINYTYTLTTNTSGDATHDDFKISITDKDGDTATDTLVVKIVDDVPTAKADTDLVSNDTNTATGNVITGVGTTTSPLGVDLKGADGATVSGISSVNVGGADNNAKDGLSIVGQYGTLTMGTDGSYTYTRFNDAPLKATDVFNYTLTDGDGDTSTTTLSVKIDDGGCEITNLTPKASGGDTMVDEDGLLASRGAGESAGSDGSGPTHNTGDFTITAPDGVQNLTVDGHSVINNGVFTASSWTTGFGNTISITNYDSATGKVSYSYTLNDNENHPTGNGENSLYEDLNVKLTDKDGDTANGTLSVNIVDDVAVAVDGAKLLTGTDQKTNVLLIMDISGSMGEDSGVDNPNAPGNYNKLQLEGQTIINLLNSYAAAGQTMVQIATFSTDASVPNLAGGWMTVSDAIALVNQIVQQGPQGATDYHDALSAGLQAFATDGKIVGADNVAYFFSDGQPNEPTDATGPLTQAEINNWVNFAQTNDVNAYAIGLGSGTVQSQLDPIAYNGQTDTNTNAFIVNNLNDLAAVIDSTLPTPQSGDIVSSLGGTFGADGGHVASLTLNGVTYTFAQAVAANAAHELTITTAGGKFVIDMDDGKYTYTPDFSKTQTNLDIAFTLIDNDGDTASAHLRLLAPLPQFTNNLTEPTITTTHDSWGTGNYTAPAGTTAGDHIRDWTSGGSVNDVHNSTINGNNGNDWIEAGAGNDTVHGNTGLDKILGGDGNDNLQGDSGNDWLDGGAGNDYLQGGDDSDKMIGGAGSDKMDGGNGTDYFLKVDAADLNGTNTLDGTHTINGGAGDDYVDLSGISNFGAAQAARLENVEALSFTGNGANTVTLDVASVLNMTDDRNNLVIHGDQGSDTVNLTGGFSKIGTDVTANDGQHYDVFQAGSGANQVTVFVDHALNATAT